MLKFAYCSGVCFLKKVLQEKIKVKIKINGDIINVKTKCVSRRYFSYIATMPMIIESSANIKPGTTEVVVISLNI